MLKPLNLNGIQSVSYSNSTSVLWTNFTKECSFPVWMIYHDVPNCNISRWRNCPFPIIIKIKTQPSTFSPGDVFLALCLLHLYSPAPHASLSKFFLVFWDDTDALTAPGMFVQWLNTCSKLSFSLKYDMLTHGFHKDMMSLTTDHNLSPVLLASVHKSPHMVSVLC